MVALPQGGPRSGQETVGWQNIRQQLFGQQRERAAEDGLLTVITQVQTRLAAVTGAESGPLRTPAARAQALRAIQEGLNSLMAWHREQIAAGQVAGMPVSEVSDLAGDVVAAVAETHTLFEGAAAKGGRVDAADVISSVAQLRGAESDAYFNEVLGGLLTMLQAVYVRIGIDAPTAPAAIALSDLWDILVDELRALECPVEPAPEHVVEPLAAPAPYLAEVSDDETPAAPAPVEALEPSAFGSRLRALASLPAVDVAESEEQTASLDSVATIVAFPARFHRFELVAC